MTPTLPFLIFITFFGLLAIGLYAMLLLRNLIKVVIALQLMAKGAILALVLAGRMTGQVDLGQSLALTLIVADTIVAVVGMSLAVQVRKHLGTLDLTALSRLKR